MNILIYGVNGWIGSQVIHYLDKEKITYCKGTSRVDNLINLEVDAGDT